MNSVGGDSPSESPSTAVGYAWYVVGLLAVLYAVSFIDRFMLVLAVDPISRDLGIGDVQIGLLLGAGFAVVYSLGGLPIAQMLDRHERRSILAAGVVLWSAATLGSAFARTFAMLAACRAVLALGQSVLTPAAVSLIADLFPRDKRVLPVSVYSAVSAVMVTGALIVDGAALQLARAWAPIQGEAPWRIALCLIGTPGLLLALIFWFTMREPARTASTKSRPTIVGDDTSVRIFIGYLRRQWRFYLPSYLGTGLFSMYGLSMVSWVPTLMVRKYGFSSSMTGYLLGAVGVPAAFFGTFFWPWLAAHLERRGRRDGIMIAYMVATIVAAPFLIAAPLAYSPWLMLSGLGIVISCLSAAGVLSSLAAQSYGPNQMRARLMALTLLVINLIGYTIGPQFVVFVSKHWPNDPRGLGYGLAILGLASGPLSAIAIAFSRWSVVNTSLLSERD